MRRSVPGALLVAAALTCVAACSSGDAAPSASSSPSGSTGGSAAAGASPTGSGATTGADLTAGRATAALVAAPAVRAKGSVVADGGTVRVDMLLGPAGATGTVELAAGTVQVIRIGQVVWFKGDRKYWTSTGGSATADQFTGSFVKVDASEPDFAPFVRFTDPVALRDLLITAVPESVTAGAGGATTVGGVQAVELKGLAGAALLVAAAGEPRPLQLTTAGEGAPVLTFTYDEPLEPAPPPAADVVTLS